MPKINQTILRSLPIPLPPITEQHRIVAKVDELMTICNELESHLTTAETDGRRLLEAVLYEALRTAANRKAIAGVIASQPSIGVAPKKPQTFHSTSAGST